MTDKQYVTAGNTPVSYMIELEPGAILILDTVGNEAKCVVTNRRPFSLLHAAGVSYHMPDEMVVAGVPTICESHAGRRAGLAGYGRLFSCFLLYLLQAAKSLALYCRRSKDGYKLQRNHAGGQTSALAL